MYLFNAVAKIFSKKFQLFIDSLICTKAKSANHCQSIRIYQNKDRNIRQIAEQFC